MQLVKFGAVGGVGVVLNVVVFNVLLATVFKPSSVHLGPIYATVVATLVAIVANWVGNRYWAFRADRQKNTAREALEFFLVSFAALGIPLLCVWVSHYVLGFTHPIADTIANNVVGLALGTLFRFALYRWWVYSPDRARAAEERAARKLGIETLTAPLTQATLAGGTESGLVRDN
jgi:putative flippase GtrA